MIRLAANALSTVELVKTMLSIPQEDTSYDSYLTLIINYASSWIQSITGRRLGLSDYVHFAAGSGQQELVLSEYPIRRITSIIDKDTGAVYLPESYSFEEDGRIGVVYKDTGWPRKAHPTGLAPDYILTRQYLQVRYTAGYVLPKDITDDTPQDWELPADLQGVVSQIAAQELALQDNGAGGLSSFGIADVSWSFDKTPRQSWVEILETYKKVV